MEKASIRHTRRKMNFELYTVSAPVMIQSFLLMIGLILEKEKKKEINQIRRKTTEDRN